MITNSKQNWQVGATVKVGFMSLRVLGMVKTPGDFKPDQYALANADNTRFYRFVPHFGCERVANLSEAMQVS